MVTAEKPLVAVADKPQFNEDGASRQIRHRRNVPLRLAREHNLPAPKVGIRVEHVTRHGPVIGHCRDDEVELARGQRIVKAVKVDVDQLQIAVSTLQNEFIAAKQLVDVSYRFLVYNMGYGLDSNIVITESLQEIIGGLTRDLIEQEFIVTKNYDYRIVDTQEKLAAIDLKRYRAEYLPTLTAFLSHQQMAMRNDFNFFSTDDDWYPATMLGFSLSIPVFSSGMRKARISQARINLEKTQNSKKDLANALELQVQQARIDFRTAYQKYLNEKSNIELARKIFDLTSIKYQNGMVSSLELTIATEQLTGAQTGIIQAMVELLNTKLALDKALGNI